MLAGLVLLASTNFAFADPTGHYQVDGVNPDGSTYKAAVLVAKIGDTFSITYTMPNNATVKGTAIGDDTVLSVGYSGGGDTGVALMYRDGDSWQGVWTYLGAKKLGTETWTESN
jgi:hypothetical protein